MTMKIFSFFSSFGLVDAAFLQRPAHDGTVDGGKTAVPTAEVVGKQQVLESGKSNSSLAPKNSAACITFIEGITEKLQRLSINSDIDTSIKDGINVQTDTAGKKSTRGGGVTSFLSREGTGGSGGSRLSKNDKKQGNVTTLNTTLSKIKNSTLGDKPLLTLLEYMIGIKKEIATGLQETGCSPKQIDGDLKDQLQSKIQQHLLSELLKLYPTDTNNTAIIQPDIQNATSTITPISPAATVVSTSSGAIINPHKAKLVTPNSLHVNNPMTSPAQFSQGSGNTKHSISNLSSYNSSLISSPTGNALDSMRALNKTTFTRESIGALNNKLFEESTLHIVKKLYSELEKFQIVDLDEVENKDINTINNENTTVNNKHRPYKCSRCGYCNSQGPPMTLQELDVAMAARFTASMDRYRTERELRPRNTGSTSGSSDDDEDKRRSRRNGESDRSGSSFRKNSRSNSPNSPFELQLESEDDITVRSKASYMQQLLNRMLDKKFQEHLTHLLPRIARSLSRLQENVGELEKKIEIASTDVVKSKAIQKLMDEFVKSNGEIGGYTLSKTEFNTDRRPSNDGIITGFSDGIGVSSASLPRIHNSKTRLATKNSHSTGNNNGTLIEIIDVDHDGITETVDPAGSSTDKHPTVDPTVAVIDKIDTLRAKFSAQFLAEIDGFQEFQNIVLSTAELLELIHHLYEVNMKNEKSMSSYEESDISVTHCGSTEENIKKSESLSKHESETDDDDNKNSDSDSENSEPEINEMSDEHREKRVKKLTRKNSALGMGQGSMVKILRRTNSVTSLAELEEVIQEAKKTGLLANIFYHSIPLFAGLTITSQFSINSRTGQVLQNPLFATFINAFGAMLSIMLLGALSETNTKIKSNGGCLNVVKTGCSQCDTTLRSNLNNDGNSKKSQVPAHWSTTYTDSIENGEEPDYSHWDKDNCINETAADYIPPKTAKDSKRINAATGNWNENSLKASSNGGSYGSSNNNLYNQLNIKNPSTKNTDELEVQRLDSEMKRFWRVMKMLPFTGTISMSSIAMSCFVIPKIGVLPYNLCRTGGTLISASLVDHLGLIGGTDPETKEFRAKRRKCNTKRALGASLAPVGMIISVLNFLNTASTSVTSDSGAEENTNAAANTGSHISPHDLAWMALATFSGAIFPIADVFFVRVKHEVNGNENPIKFGLIIYVVAVIWIFFLSVALSPVLKAMTTEVIYNGSTSNGNSNLTDNISDINDIMYQIIRNVSNSNESNLSNVSGLDYPDHYSYSPWLTAAEIIKNSSYFLSNFPFYYWIAGVFGTCNFYSCITAIPKIGSLRWMILTFLSTAVSSAIVDSIGGLELDQPKLPITINKGVGILIMLLSSVIVATN